MALMELWIEAKEISALRLVCDHCKAESIFVAGNLDVDNEVRCSNCETLMTGGRDLLVDFERFLNSVKQTTRIVRFKASFPTHGQPPA